MRDPYEVLGVGRDATEADIKAAFRRLAAQHHPDRNPGDAGAVERFKELNQAFQVLSDPQKRAAYDRYGAAAFDPHAGGGAGFSAQDIGFDGIFGDILGAFGFRSPDAGDVRLNVRLTFEEAILGCEKELSYDCLDTCGRCSGSTAEPGSSIEICPMCRGRGRVRVQQALFPIAVERVCNRCNGVGKSPTQRCGGCSGRGVAPRRRSIQISIPPGIEDRSSRTVERAGNRIRADRPAGDLIMTVSVAPHEYLRREDDDLVCRLPVSFLVATLGGEVEVRTLQGRETLRVPPGTQAGSTLRIRGEGVPHRMRGGRGDLLVEIQLSVPTKLTERARAILNELGHELEEDEEPSERTFVDKLRSFFE